MRGVAGIAVGIAPIRTVAVRPPCIRSMSASRASRSARIRCAQPTTCVPSLVNPSNLRPRRTIITPRFVSSFADPTGQRRLTDVAQPRRAAEVARASQRDEVFELTDQHFAVHVPIVAREDANRAPSLTISIKTFDLPSLQPCPPEAASDTILVAPHTDRDGGRHFAVDSSGTWGRSGSSRRGGLGSSNLWGLIRPPARGPPGPALLGEPPVQPADQLANVGADRIPQALQVVTRLRGPTRVGLRNSSRPLATVRASPRRSHRPSCTASRADRARGHRTRRRR